MSSASRLNRFYGGFFSSLPPLVFKPYTVAFELGSGSAWSDEYFNPADGILLCILLSLPTFPLLPVLTLITASFLLALAAVVLASMLVAYPLGAVIDDCSNDESACSRFSYGM